jgi:hypothetical protein
MGCTVQNLAWRPCKVENSALNIQRAHCVPVYRNVCRSREPDRVPPASLATNRQHSTAPTGDMKWNELLLSNTLCFSTGNFISRGAEHCGAGGGISGYVEKMSALRRAVPFLLYHHHVLKCYINLLVIKVTTQK